MEITIRKSQPDDYAFLREMLYEAVFWRRSESTPSFEEGLSLPDVAKALSDWKSRSGDTAVIALEDSQPVGAAWYRYWKQSDNMRGYCADDVPVIAIAVKEGCRHMGIGAKLIQGLLSCAKEQGIDKVSLCVSKDNYAINLYRQQGFLEEIDIGDSYIMGKHVKR